LRNRRKNAANRDSSASMYKPLRGFVRGMSVIRHCDDVDDVGPSSARGGCTNPILWPRRDELFAGAGRFRYPITVSLRQRGKEEGD
jgi:hypothetical protein